MSVTASDSQPGKVQDLIKIEGTHVKIPMSVVTGVKKGPTVFITAGIHGSEYPAILAMIELCNELDPAQISGRLIVLHPVNTQAFWTRIAAILPEDGCNLNRVFPGDPEGGVSAKTAWRLGQFQELADFHLDLHSGDLYENLTPFVYYPLIGEPAALATAKKAAEVLNVGYMTGSDNQGGAIVSAAKRGTPALLVERGGAGNCFREDVDLYKKDVVNVLKHLGVLAGPPELPAAPPENLEQVTYLKATLNALWQPAVTAGQKVSAGQKLGELFDFFGKTVEVFTAERDGVVLFHLRTLAANAGDVLVAY